MKFLNWRHCKNLKKQLNNKGLTLLELIVSVGLFGVLFLGAFQIMNIGVLYSTNFQRSLRVTEFMADAITQIGSAMPQVTKINEIACRCSTGTSKSCAYWSETEPAADPGWYDPVFDGSHSNDGNPKLIFEGEFDAWYGGTGSLTADETLTNYITAGFGTPFACYTSSHLSASEQRGCTLLMRIYYTEPVKESGSVASTPGYLEMRVSSVAAPSSYTAHRIGEVSGKLGVVRVSCGLDLGDSATSDVPTNIFVLNIRLKMKTRYTNDTSDAHYESWHPSGSDYNNGIFRDVKLRFSFPNLSTRGVYQWKMQSVQNCKSAGETASSWQECCSGALDSGSCLASCIEPGAAGTDDSCCSNKASSGNCL